MTLWCSCGGYVFHVEVKSEILTFKVKFDRGGQNQSPSKTMGILTKVFCISGPKLVILAWMVDELWCGQAQNGVNLDFKVKFDIEDQFLSPHKTKWILTKVFYTFYPNLVILTWMGDELSHGQSRPYRTHGRTHRQTQATTMPGGQNWSGVETDIWQHPGSALQRWSTMPYTVCFDYTRNYQVRSTDALSNVHETWSCSIRKTASNACPKYKVFLTRDQQCIQWQYNCLRLGISAAICLILRDLTQTPLRTTIILQQPRHIIHMYHTKPNVYMSYWAGYNFPFQCTCKLVFPFRIYVSATLPAGSTFPV